MLKKDLIDAVAVNTKNTRKDVTPVVDEVFNVILETLAKDEDVKIIDFGNFKVKHRAKRVGVHPLNHEKIDIPAKNVVDFIASGNMKKMVASSFKEEE
jgi:DNA-binding protein HU-beta